MGTELCKFMFWLFFISGIVLFVFHTFYSHYKCEEEIFPQGGAKLLNTSTKHSILFDERLILLKIPQNTSLCDTSLNSLV